MSCDNNTKLYAILQCAAIRSSYDGNSIEAYVSDCERAYDQLNQKMEKQEQQKQLPSAHGYYLEFN